ncbi:glycosyltransferase family 4 protein [Thalassospira povalilytica]|uniref:Glycosyltransferase family 1 protein n=1 Tax=Thalassospira povalilytica TaxID=732237 RepID=A0A8I1SII0_9PROT|nr:glycosyltransferase family 1 protein [Thalassospira povalilytica]MBN8197317.1 glycosyltransferase family 4 protein [Thalassospira povalilytica]PKR51227.1 glycosyltransferase family 1 protein [Thalassospira povalilytica]
MRIAVFVENALEAGGTFQQTLTMVQAIQSLPGHEVVVLTPIADNIAQLRKHEIEAHLYNDGAWTRFIDTIGGLMPRCQKVLHLVQRIGFRRFGQNLDCRLDHLSIDLAFFNARSATPIRLSRHSYVFTVWDLCHRDHPEFPEVSANREFERREQVLNAVLPKAVAVIADSEIGADKISQWYGVDRSRVHIVPFLPSVGVRSYANGTCLSSVSSVRQKYKLPEDYFFYPAQMWPHKNHLYLFEGLAELKARFSLAPALVVSGGDKGNLRYLRNCAEKLGLADQVFFLGFVNNEDIPALYDGAKALVMPTYFGPTNLPPIEAALLGCPVIYSDTRSFRSQMGSAALYCDLSDPKSLAEQMRLILEDQATVEILKSEGLKLSSSLNEDATRKSLQHIFDAYAYKRRLWNS